MVVVDDIKAKIGGTDTGAGPTMHVDPRVTMAYYSQVKGAVPTATDSKGNNVSYKFPCDASLPNLYLHFDDGAAAMAGRQMNFNIPDSENSELPIPMCFPG